MTTPTAPGARTGPETPRAKLRLADGRWTWHAFVRYEDVPAEDLLGGPGPVGLRPGRALIYRCEETGVERRWGLE